jgi:hypothetical protein
VKSTPKSTPASQKLRSNGFWLGHSWFALSLWLSSLLLVLSQAPNAWADDTLHAGFWYDSFDLTLTPGHRTEAAGPFFYSEQKESRSTWAVPPLFSYTTDPDTQSKEFDFLYPVVTYDRYGEQYRWQFFQWLSFPGGPTQKENARDRFTLFPLYWQQRSSDPSENYTAVFPFYGHIKHRLFRDDNFFVMWPLYCQTRKRDVVTDNYLVPIFSLRHGDGLHGWQFWPLIGSEHKEVTTQTNGFGDIKTIAGHDSFFALWPLYFNDRSGIGTTNVQWQQASFPAYNFVRSPMRDSTGILWPFFNYVDDRGQKYREWDAPWPLIVFARGEGKNTTRIWPFYSRARKATVETGFYLWPIYKYKQVNSEPLDGRRTRICFFLYSDRIEKNTQTKAARRRVDFLPFFSYRRDFNGNSQLQVLTLLEPFTPTSKSVERNYSPLYALWRAEKNPQTKATSQSLLWNLYRREATPETKKCSLLFGLFQYQSGSKGKNMRLFYIPLGGKKAQAPGESNAAPLKSG